MRLAQKITLSMFALLIIVGMTIGIFGYRMAYKQVEQSVGIELVGCSNITTGLVNPTDIEALLGGNEAPRAKVEKQINSIVQHKPIFKEAFILSLEGKILAADQQLQKRGYQAGDSFYFNQKDQDMIRSMKHPQYSEVYTYKQISLKTGYGPIYKNNDPTQEIVGLMAINFDASIIQQRTLDMILKPYAAGGLLFTAAAVAVYFIISRMTRPLALLTQRVEQIAAGDLTQEPLMFTGRDEVGRLAVSFDQMTSNLRKVITEVHDTSLHVSSFSQELSASAKETGAAGEQNVLIMVELADGAEKQLQVLGEGSQLVSQMSQFIHDISVSAEHAMHSASDNFVQARSGSLSMRQTAQQMKLTNENIMELAQIIGDLREQSQEIKNVLDVISEISKETHMLALNASIEAARAGVHGKGFSVVAASVRKLAERSAKSALQIDDIVQHTLSLMEIAGSSMNRTTYQVHQGSEMITAAGVSFNQIEESAEQMTLQSEEISTAVRRLAKRASHLVESIQTIVEVANQNSDIAQSMSASSEEQLAAMEEVDRSADSLSSLSEKLHILIEQFKIIKL